MAQLKWFWSFIVFIVIIKRSIQECPEEYNDRGLSVKWSQTPNAFKVESYPLCYRENHLITRNCTNGEWSPAASELESCMKVLKIFEEDSCPLTFHKILNNKSDYCFQISPASKWDLPCFTNGGASIINELDESEIDALIESLVATNISRYFWLPAQRTRLFYPVVWHIPGPNWGQIVQKCDYLEYQPSFWKNCLVLDVEQRIIITDACTEKYPSLCFYQNNIHYRAVCPEGYHPFRYKPDNGTCYGIEKSDTETGLTFQSFIKTKCQRPMKDDDHSINRFIFTEIAKRNELSESEWCWFRSLNIKRNMSTNWSENYEGIINNFGVLGFVNSSTTMSCMACETDIIFGDTELIFEFNPQNNKIYLTVYFPSGLWKYDYDDKGIQCFSDGKGFIRVLDISVLPEMSMYREIEEHEKVVYSIDLIANRSAQYWCEAHTFNFSLISTDKIIINPKGQDVHVFSLILYCYNITNSMQSTPDLAQFLNVVTETLNVKDTLLRDILDLTDEHVLALLHVHASVDDIYNNEAKNLLNRYNILKEDASNNLPSVNCSFVNLTSSVYCLPTTSHDNASNLTLDWILTPINHISAPKQFCLQSNGLPVKRQCLGSYQFGGSWGRVEGVCDGSYVPSNTTTFLYNIVIGQVSDNDTASFLTDGLGFVLSDVGLIIPADIYYLSVSLQQITIQAQSNDTSIDLGDIYNIAWVMDRVTNLQANYMHLAQTLNSTNVILSSVNDIIEMIAKEKQKGFQFSIENKNQSLTTYDSSDNYYQLAIQPQFIVQISYPEYSNVSGIAIYKSSAANNFTDMIVKPLYANTSLEEVLAIDNLEVATWLPTRLLKSLKPIHNDTESNNLLHIVINVFENDVVFQEFKNQNRVVNSRIVGVSLPGYIPNLVYPIPIVFRRINTTKTANLCSFWDFQTYNSTLSFGLWKTKGCYPSKFANFNGKYSVCKCYHLTHFSQLMPIVSIADSHVGEFEGRRHTKALNIITLVGCVLSLLGVFGIWITAMVFSNWRRKAGTKVLLQLSTAIALPLVFLLISNLDNNLFTRSEDRYVITEKYKIVCIVLGALLHYSILASFAWMLIAAILQFVRYVRVLGVSRPSRFMIKFALVGWGIPLIPVISILIIEHESYIPNPSLCKPMCYPKGVYFMLGVMLPISIILSVNIILFILVLISIARGSNDKTKSIDMDLVCAQLRLSIFLFFLLGLTWIFGIFSFTKNPLWSYLFCLTSTLQGFVLFIYFIICDPAARQMWGTLVKPAFSTSSSRNSITSIYS